MAKKKKGIFKPEIPKMPSGVGEGKRSLTKRKKDRSGTVSRSRYESDKASTPT